MTTDHQGISPVSYAEMTAAVLAGTHFMVFDARKQDPAAFPEYPVELTNAGLARAIVSALLVAGWSPPDSLRYGRVLAGAAAGRAQPAVAEQERDDAVPLRLSTGRCDHVLREAIVKLNRDARDAGNAVGASDALCLANGYRAEAYRIVLSLIDGQEYDDEYQEGQEHQEG